ncbi:SNARE associated Golgi protein [uncultured archaeon]|nr:SNARE associated Golgi protein [uncultured archaeon]
MDISQILNLFIHLDKVLASLTLTYGVWIYLIIFIIIFCETGLVVTPFLPGDSLIFVMGTLAAKNLLSVIILFFIVCLAAIIGDSVNYWIGKIIGREAFNKKIKFLNKENLYRAEKFYEKHGGKTIIYARFIPIIRTFAPFVAGIGKMKYSKFLAFNIIGGVLWGSIFLFAGFFFGNLDFVKNNLSLVIIGIILISLIPPIIEYLRNKKEK